MNLPANVGTPVRVSQALILVIALFSQNDLLNGVESLSLGRPTSYRGSDRFSKISRLQWKFASILRISQGLLNVFCSFILSIQSETVFDVVLNVMGVGFVSGLDDVAFHLAGSGYFGGKVKRSAKDIEHGDFVRERYYGQMSCLVGLKKSFHTIVAFSVLGLAIFFFTFLSIQQNNGVYTLQNLHVIIGDTEIPYLGLLNGCYEATNEIFNQRIVYKQVGSVGIKDAEFYYCPNLWNGRGAWELGIEHTSYIPRCALSAGGNMISEATTAYDLMDVASDRWHFDEEYTLADSFDIYETNDCKDFFDGRYVRSFNDCRIVQSETSVPMYLVQNEPADGNIYSNTATSHAVYASSKDVIEEETDIIFFTGRRWVLTTAAQIGFNGSDILEYLSTYEMHWSFSSDWVTLISEDVLRGPSDYYPFGVQWYYPDLVGQTYLPAADTSRPAPTLECARCSPDTNQCTFGTCNRTTRICECQHNETGALCQNLPLGNGICDEFFNEDMRRLRYFSDSRQDMKLDYDGGDCCGSTCTQSHCGNGALETLFGASLEVEISKQFIGYQKCKNEQMAVLLLQIIPLPTASDVHMPPFEVQCGEGNVTYLRTPLFLTAAPEALQSERIMVPCGVNCQMRIEGISFSTGVDRIRLLLEGQSLVDGTDQNGTDTLLLERTIPFDEDMKW
eukprot:CAMPEP_0113606214 /NCGR_PEP_ID=MMETSP0017_2-20120614/2737_1 /TAXON_ID=2856 /ORGANISM="Cylindrotheca closterium" /LENGTH=674 /DNA_ID=CAMNT_0000514747 /DNA_START=107 /DNA_END=2128 /DNA_ORIENTATION=+ /assembly_acc=CAM_ASM_000147